MKQTSKAFYLDQVKVQVDSSIGDHSNDPFVVKKGKASLKRIQKYGFPIELLKIQAERTKK